MNRRAFLTAAALAPVVAAMPAAAVVKKTIPVIDVSMLDSTCDSFPVVMEADLPRRLTVTYVVPPIRCWYRGEIVGVV